MITIELETRAQQDLLIRLLHREYSLVQKKYPWMTGQLERIAEVIDIVEEAEGPEEE